MNKPGVTLLAVFLNGHSAVVEFELLPQFVKATHNQRCYIDGCQCHPAFP